MANVTKLAITAVLLWAVTIGIALLLGCGDEGAETPLIDSADIIVYVYRRGSADPTPRRFWGYGSEAQGSAEFCSRMMDAFLSTWKTSNIIAINGLQGIVN